MKPVRFTQHAFDRIRTRLRLSHKEVADIIDSGRAIPIGQEQGSMKTHLMFFSEPDKQCFIAIQNSESGCVITILPLDYAHGYKIPWWAVYKLITGRGMAPTPGAEGSVTGVSPRGEEANIVNPNTMFHILILFENHVTQKIRTIKFNIPVRDYPNFVFYPQLLAREPAVDRQIRERIFFHLDPPSESILRIMIQVGRQGMLVSIDTVSYKCKLAP